MMLPIYCVSSRGYILTRGVSRFFSSYSPSGLYLESISKTKSSGRSRLLEILRYVKSLEGTHFCGGNQAPPQVITEDCKYSRVSNSDQ